MGILKDPDQPRHEGSLAVVAGQNRRAMGTDEQMAPKLGHSAFLLFLVSRIKPGGTRSQRIDEQAVRSTSPGGKKRFPCSAIVFQAGTGDIPINGMKLIEKRFLACLRLLGAKKCQTAIEVSSERLKRQPD